MKSGGLMKKKYIAILLTTLSILSITVGITGNTISFDGKFYKVADSIAKEIVEEIKNEGMEKKI